MKNAPIHFILSLIIMLTGMPAMAQPEKGVNDTTYMLTYDHGGLILWGSDHFMERLRNAVGWLDKYRGFKIGLDNEAYVYDYLGKNEPGKMSELKGYLSKYRGRFGIGSATYGQPLSQFINDESNIRQIAYALAAEEKYFSYRPPVYLMSEHAMHSQLPQILNGFGFDGAIMRTHFMMYGYNPTFSLPIGYGPASTALGYLPYLLIRAKVQPSEKPPWIPGSLPVIQAVRAPSRWKPSGRNSGI